MYITNNIPLVSRFFRKILQQTRRWQKRWWGRTQTEQWPPPQRNTCWPPARDLSLFDQCHETANRKTQNIYLFQTKLHDCNWVQEKHMLIKNSWLQQHRIISISQNLQILPMVGVEPGSYHTLLIELKN